MVQCHGAGRVATVARMAGSSAVCGYLWSQGEWLTPPPVSFVTPWACIARVQAWTAANVGMAEALAVMRAGIEDVGGSHDAALLLQKALNASHMKLTEVIISRNAQILSIAALCEVWNCGVHPTTKEGDQGRPCKAASSENAWCMT
jgi:hypothetical protein